MYKEVPWSLNTSQRLYIVYSPNDINNEKVQQETLEHNCHHHWIPRHYLLRNSRALVLQQQNSTKKQLQSL